MNLQRITRQKNRLCVFFIQTAIASRVQITSKKGLGAVDKKTIMRKAISDAFETVLEKADSIQDITVQDILDECGLSRPTFYRYFSDKYDVANWSYTYHVEQLTGLYENTDPVDNENMTRNFVQFFYNKKSYFHKVMDYVGQNSFYDHYFSCLVYWYTTMHYQNPGDVNTLTAEEKYMLIYQAAGTVQLLRKWLSDGCLQTPNEIVHIIIQNVPEKTRNYST